VLVIASTYLDFAAVVRGFRLGITVSPSLAEGLLLHASFDRNR
jgi:hypothetical protein